MVKTGCICYCGHGSGEAGCRSRRCLALERRNSCRQENGRCRDQELNYNLVRKRSDMECPGSCSGLETVVISSKGHRRDRRRRWTMGSMQEMANAVFKSFKRASSL
jgi:hypothetical protein